MNKKKKKVKESEKNIDTEKTAIYKPVRKKRRKKKKHPKLRMFFKIMLVSFILLAVIIGRNICSNTI